MKNCIFFQPNKAPTYLNQSKSLSIEDEAKIGGLITRLNSQDKQFFFASNPIFVEGYTDQQLFSLIQEKRGKFLGASGACIIEVGGKDELDLFFRLSKHLFSNPCFITDLDALFLGEIRKSVVGDERSMLSMKQTSRVEHYIDLCIKSFEMVSYSDVAPYNDVGVFYKTLLNTKDKAKKRYIFTLSLQSIKDKIEIFIPDKGEELKYIDKMMDIITQGFNRCGVYILIRGELENYLPAYSGNIYEIADNKKIKVFLEERNFLLNVSITEEDLYSRYPELIDILDKTTQAQQINIDSSLCIHISNFIHKTQLAFSKDKVVDSTSLQDNPNVEWDLYSQLFNLTMFSSTNGNFICKLKIKPSLDPLEREVCFDGDTVPSKFKFNN